jgi:hypothetical protein
MHFDIETTDRLRRRLTGQGYEPVVLAPPPLTCDG